MLKRLVLVMAVAAAMWPCTLRVLAQAKSEVTAEKTTSIGEKTKSMEKMAGYFNIYWDAKAGKLWLEIDKWGTEFLYQSSMPAGIGSNDIGLDRGQLGGTHVVRFERSGPKVLLVQSNLEFRAVSEDADERRAVRDSFAESALWGFTVAAEEGDGLVGLHGTNAPGSIGRAVSHGCIRMSNSGITKLAGILPLGTPLFVGP